MKPHKHAEVIKAWADGHTIQYSNQTTNLNWTDMPICSPNWHENVEYRVKPKPSPDVVRYYTCRIDNEGLYRTALQYNADLVLVYDGETGKLKKAEVLK